jgi:UDP-glucuronate 4-epimerase
MQGKPLKLYNNGQMKRDFTYVDDIIDAIARLVFTPPETEPDIIATTHSKSKNSIPHRIYNIGNHTPVAVDALVRLIEKAVGKQAIIENAPMQPGDVYETCADVSALTAATGFSPDTPIEKGVAAFVDWYRTWLAGNPA